MYTKIISIHSLIRQSNIFNIFLRTFIGLIIQLKVGDGGIQISLDYKHKHFELFQGISSLPRNRRFMQS